MLGVMHGEPLDAGEVAHISGRDDQPVHERGRRDECVLHGRGVRDVQARRGAGDLGVDREDAALVRREAVSGLDAELCCAGWNTRLGFEAHFNDVLLR
jgi:hypothetical protein